MSGSSTVDPDRRCISRPFLCNKEGEDVDTKDVTKDILELIHDKMRPEAIEDDNVLRRQIVPLMNEVMIEALYTALPKGEAFTLLADETIRGALLTLILTGFYLLKTIQVRELKIRVDEEEIDEEAVESARRLSLAISSMATLMGAGYTPSQVLKAMIERGIVRESDLTNDLRELLHEKGEDKDESGN